MSRILSKGSIMSVGMFSELLAKCDLSPDSKQYFPIWVGRYANFSKKSPPMRLVVERELVIAFLRSLRDTGVTAWQRLQAVRAIECYRDVVLCVATPDLRDVVQKLTEIAERERRAAEQTGMADSHLAESVGLIDPNEPAVIQTLRGECRLLHYSRRTEKAYAGDCPEAGSSKGADRTSTHVACAATFVRHAFARSRFGHSHRAGFARPRR